MMFLSEGLNGRYKYHSAMTRSTDKWDEGPRIGDERRKGLKKSGANAPLKQIILFLSSVSCSTRLWGDRSPQSRVEQL